MSEQNMMRIIDSLAQDREDIPLQEIKEHAEREDIDHVEDILDCLEGQGLILRTEGGVRKIAKRLFW